MRNILFLVLLGLSVSAWSQQEGPLGPFIEPEQPLGEEEEGALRAPVRRGVPRSTILDLAESRNVDTVRRHLLAVDRQAREEFARSETVSCDGWVLAKSEARLCAAIARRATGA